jgi:hypothetical protein
MASAAGRREKPTAAEIARLFGLGSFWQNGFCGRADQDRVCSAEMALAAARREKPTSAEIPGLFELALRCQTGFCRQPSADRVCSSEMRFVVRNIRIGFVLPEFISGPCADGTSEIVDIRSAKLTQRD